MPIKIIPAESFQDAGVKLDQIKALSKNYYKQMKKKNNGGQIKDMNNIDDAKSAWFTKEKLDELFNDNGCPPGTSKNFGLRIYFGVHKMGILKDNMGNDIKPEYDNQQMVVLVVTKNEDGIFAQDQLNVNNSVDIVGYQGEGLNHGKLCPPEICDGSVI